MVMSPLPAIAIAGDTELIVSIVAAGGDGIGGDEVTDGGNGEGAGGDEVPHA
jgi:hypothetical protein